MSEKRVIHKADSRGHADHGWLDSHHSFSFASYHNPARVHFGKLRVLNDDIVSGGRGFGQHPHDNMEIISIPMSGDLEHKDSMGNTTVIRQNDVQIMSAGTGIQHSEYNKNAAVPVNFLQIWIFPKVKDIEPRYDQQTFNPAGRINTWQTVVSPEGEAEGIDINQDAWLSLGNLKKGFETTYRLHLDTNGLYVFVLDGEVEVDGQLLNRRDGMGISEGNELAFKAITDTELLLIEVPV